MAALALAILAAAAATSAPAAAAPAVSDDARREAGQKFEYGKRAFDAGDFTRAAAAFEAAYKLSPHEDSLWNAARAWHRAGELPRAANLYARYLREAPPNAADRAGATSALASLGARLGRIEVHVDAGVEDARVDDTPIDGPFVYVLPGAHVLRGVGAHGPLEARTSVAAGAAVSVVLAEAEPPPAAPPPAPPAAPPPSRARAPESASTGWSPVVVLVGGALTVVLTGLTVWSGLDTMSTLHTFEATPTQGGLDSGRSEEVRTNVLLGASLGAAALTAVTAAFLVDWHGRRREPATVGLGPSGALVQGRF
jgi:hypothetical protein